MRGGTAGFVKAGIVSVAFVVAASAFQLLAASRAEATTQIWVAQCVFDELPCYSAIIPTPWSYTFTPSQLSFFQSGSVPLVATQTAVYTIQLSETTLSLTTTDGPITSMVGSFTGPPFYLGPFPSAPHLVGTFDYTIPVGATITGASIAGDFGNSVNPTTAGVNVCVGLGPCAAVTVTPEPSNLVYFATTLPALAGWVGWRRRRRFA
jgi:hypothetical protein